MKLLFLCTHNACRSVLAESISRQHGQGLWTVASAGSQPAVHIHPDTLTVLTEKNLPTEGLYSKSWDDVSDFNPDIVITVCDQVAGESCPVWFGKAIKTHWGLPDPTRQTDTTQKRSEFEQVISTLESRLQGFASFIRQQPNATSQQLQAELKRLEGMK